MLSVWELLLTGESTEAASLKFNLSAYWTRGLHSNRTCLSLTLTVIHSPTAHWPSVITLLDAHKRTVGCKLQPLLIVVWPKADI